MADTPPGAPSWVDLSTPDVEASVAFYGDLFGWEATEAGPAEETGGYRMFSYLTVGDTDATVQRAQELGATVLVPPNDIPPGRMAMLADPYGATFGIVQPTGAAREAARSPSGVMAD
jgi:predicted enzyme related to lactoylglutathione lyase